MKTIAVGSGEAIALGEKGDADVLLVHSPADEEEFMADGNGTSRKAVMHNDFVLVGPPDDPAKIKQAGGASEALTTIAEEKAPFASRGDDSGTHTKELSLWEGAGTEPSGSWYLETGQGMGETLTIADQKEAYTLSDRGTFLATDNLDSELLVEGGKDLLNPYHVIVVRGREGQPGLRGRFLRLDHLAGHPDRDRGLRRGRVRRVAVPSGRQGLMDPIYEVLGRSALVSLSATAIALTIGCPLGSWLALARRARPRAAGHLSEHRHGRSRRWWSAWSSPCFSGAAGRSAGLDLIYTLRGMMIAQVLIATPLIAGITMAALLALPPELPDQLRALGANRRQLAVRLWIEARVPLLAAAMAGFGHAISEVGAATIVGGNIHGQTQVMTTSIVEDVGRGDFNQALVYAAVLVGLAFAINALLTTVQQRAAAWAQS